MTKKLAWHRAYNHPVDGDPHSPDHVADGKHVNYTVARFPYGWELFTLPHGEKHLTGSPSGPWQRQKDAKAHAQHMETATS